MDLILSKADNRILWIVKVLLGLCLATPLFISNSFLFPFTSFKAFFFRIFVEIAAVFYFYLALKYPIFRPKKTALSILVGVFLLVWFLSAIFGVDFHLSFLGNFERMLGVFGIMHFVVFFLMLTGIFRTEKSWLNLLKISAALSSFIAILAIIQRFASIGLAMPQTGRVFGTIGNPAFLASYLIFNIFFAAYLFFVSGTQAGKYKKQQIILWFACFLILLIALFLTGTRGAYVGFFAGAILCLILFSLFYPAGNYRKYFLAGLILIFIFGGLIFAFRNSSFVRSSPDLNRLASISLKDVTAQNRLILWQKAWTAWRQRPFFGWGPENYEVAINKHFDARLLPYEAWYDRAHNFIFDYGVASGWVGLSAFISLIAVAVFYLKKISRRDFSNLQKAKEEKWKSRQQNETSRNLGINSRIFMLTVILAGLIFAYLVQNLFVFDTFVSYLMLFFILAVINFYFIADNQQKPAEQKLKITSLDLGKKIMLTGLAVVVIFSVYFLNIKPISASFRANQILSLDSQNYDQAEPLLKNALELKTFASDEIVYQVSLDYLDKIPGAPQLTENENFYTLVSSYLAQTIERSPAQARNYVALAWLNLYFSSQNPERISSAIGEAEKIKALSPIKKDAYLILVAAYSLNNENQKAQEVIVQAQEIDSGLAKQIEEYYNDLNKK